MNPSRSPHKTHRNKSSIINRLRHCFASYYIRNSPPPYEHNSIKTLSQVLSETTSLHILYHTTYSLYNKSTNNSIMTADSTIPSQAAAVASQNGHPRTKICVYCGAAPGASPAHIEAARALGRAMAENNIDLGESQREAVRQQPMPTRTANRRPPGMTPSWLTPDNSLWRRNCRTYGRGGKEPLRNQWP